ncbi:14-3-3 family epsilon domain protein (macronuclear) [Tetrahymena thermophila SB210]|uniref:14-3-3 family epsilon domain protein n=1 Tax=Tetrahymena thermophila (strain SB210) TaxID=312017 RepID=Q23GC1_TETTS|nr:14-3-3 family epsilon domain protein [Tetrahymena thermophila SB210]EAR95339.2 14-3-3 family epsilon domain protein [Tetrahymena thermophila SB210]|eukprot:XP_001015584.2 14-3-3 family epsilon domain protein [Tetrahymena thermophila SB210]
MPQYLWYIIQIQTLSLKYTTNIFQLVEILISFLQQQKNVNSFIILIEIRKYHPIFFENKLFLYQIQNNMKSNLNYQIFKIKLNKVKEKNKINKMDNNLNHFQFKIHQLSREELAYALKLSSRLERYDEVLEIVKLLSMHNEQLCEEEYKLFDKALSFYFCSKIQPIKKMEQKNLDYYQYEKLGQNFLQNIINNYKLNIISESEEMIQTIERLLMNKNISDLQRYYCYSIRGDCYRYIAENNLGNIHLVDDALQAYFQAEENLRDTKDYG